MDIPDLAAAVRAVWRILQPQGWFVFSITHPCFEAPHARWINHADGTTSREVRQYFEEGLWFSNNKQGVRGQVGAHHRMLSTYLNTLADAGFHTERVVEPRAQNEADGHTAGYHLIPAFMVMRYVKPLA